MSDKLNSILEQLDEVETSPKPTHGYSDYNDANTNSNLYTIQELKQLKPGDKVFTLNTIHESDDYSLEVRMSEMTVHSNDEKFLTFVEGHNVFYPKYKDEDFAEIDGVKFLKPKDTTPKVVIGKFKPRKKFLSFVTSVKSRVRFITDVAFIKGEKLSGLGLDGIIFQLTICDEGTVNFEEVDTKLTDEALRTRLLDDICDREVGTYAQKFILRGLDFYTRENTLCYLEVEHIKPFDKLSLLMEDAEAVETNIETMSQEISEKGRSFLDDLFASDEETPVIEEVKEEIVEPVKEKTFAEKMIEESFKKMNDEKINELKVRIDKREDEIRKYKYDVINFQSRLKESTDELRILNSRLELMSPGEEPNGFVFYVSDEQKTGITPDPEMVRVVKQIAPVLKLREEAVINMLTQGYYIIRIAKAEDITTRLTQIERETYSKITSIDVAGKFSLVEGKNMDEIEYRGDFKYHELVEKLSRKGFITDPAFNKLCESNSYVSKTKEKEDANTEEKKDCGCGEGCNCGTGTACGDGEFVLTDGNGNILPDDTQRSTALAHAIGAAFAPKENEKPVAGGDIHDVGEGVFGKCKLGVIETPLDPRITVIQKLGLPALDKMSEYDLCYAIKDIVKNWPDVSQPENDGSDNYSDYEELDLENTEFVKVNDKVIKICAGGDWQCPLTLTIQSDGKELYVTDMTTGYSSGISEREIKENFSLAVIRDQRLETVINSDNKENKTN